MREITKEAFDVIADKLIAIGIETGKKLAEIEAAVFEIDEKKHAEQHRRCFRCEMHHPVASVCCYNSAYKKWLGGEIERADEVYTDADEVYTDVEAKN